MIAMGVGEQDGVNRAIKSGIGCPALICDAVFDLKPTGIPGPNGCQHPIIFNLLLLYGAKLLNPIPVVEITTGIS